MTPEEALASHKKSFDAALDRAGITVIEERTKRWTEAEKTFLEPGKAGWHGNYDDLVEVMGLI